MSRRLCASALVVGGLLGASVLCAQRVRVTGSTSVRYIELRAFVRDSVEAQDSAGSALLRQLPDGRIVRCIPGQDFCYDVHPGEMQSTIPVIQDVSVSAWGFGRGVQLFSQLRGRTSLGSRRDLWPRQDDHLEVLSLYGELQRGRARVRAGRQWRVSGLGFYNFDGVALAVRPMHNALIEAYGGRSLVRGLNEGRTDGALEAIENRSASNTGVLLGLQARYRPNAKLSLATVYQLDVRRDRRGAYSELAAADGVLRLAAGSAEAAVEMDVAGRALNEARLTLRSAPVRQTSLFAEARRYRPYFEMWTIWGAFSPVGFDEAKGGFTWAARNARVIVNGEASYRRYGDAATDAPDEYLTSGWGLGSRLTLVPLALWNVDASYRVESGFGAARWDGHAAVRRELPRIGDIALMAVAFQRLYEFRVSGGTVFGAGCEGSLTLSDRWRLYLSAMAYRQRDEQPSGLDWNQRRVSLRFEWEVGEEPTAYTPGAPR